jgi:hypothetical protein
MPKLSKIFQNILPEDYGDFGISPDDRSDRRQFKTNLKDFQTNKNSEGYDYLKLLYDALGQKDQDPGDFIQKHLGDVNGRQNRAGNMHGNSNWSVRNGRKRRNVRRRKRHVGPHDEGGLQRLISTG